MIWSFLTLFSVSFWAFLFLHFDLYSLFQFLYMLPALESHGENMSANLCIHFIGGGLAGITAASATYPLDLVRTRLTAQVRSICPSENILRQMFCFLVIGILYYCSMEGCKKHSFCHCFGPVVQPFCNVIEFICALEYVFLAWGQL